MNARFGAIAASLLPRAGSPASIASAAGAVGLKLVTIVTLVTSIGTGCDLTPPDPVTEVIVGGISLTRSQRDNQRYELQVSTLNRTGDVLESFLFQARAVASVSTDESLEAPLRIEVPAGIGPGVRIPLKVTIESPFAIVPPGPLRLEEIRLGEFTFLQEETGERYTLPGWIIFPWPVEENQ